MGTENFRFHANTFLSVPTFVSPSPMLCNIKVLLAINSARISLHPFPAAAAKSLQSCPTLCDPIDGSPPDSPVPGILQARTLEWGAMKVKSESEVAQSCPTLATPWTAAHQAPPFMGFPRQEYWSGVPLPSPSLLLGHLYCEC